MASIGPQAQYLLLYTGAWGPCERILLLQLFGPHPNSLQGICYWAQFYGKLKLIVQGPMPKYWAHITRPWAPINRPSGPTQRKIKTKGKANYSALSPQFLHYIVPVGPFYRAH